MNIYRALYISIIWLLLFLFISLVFLILGIRLPDLKNRSVLVVGASLIEEVRASSLEAEKRRSI